MICPNCKILLYKEDTGWFFCHRCSFRTTDNHLLKIEEMFAFIAVDEKGNEGVPAINTPMGVLPLMGADIERAKSYRPFVEELAKNSKMKIRFVKFTNRIELEEF